MLSRLQPLAKLGRNPSLRRSGIGFALFNSAEYGEWIAVLVYAYAHGGASASGLIAFAQLLPCVVLAPLLATFADRHAPGRVLVLGFAAQAVGMGLLAVALLAHAPPFVVYAFAILAAPTFNITRPTVNVLLPLAVRTPDELTAGNAAIGWIENAGVVVGPLLTSLVVAVSGPGAVVALFAVLMLFAAWIGWPLAKSIPAAERAETTSPMADAVEGFRLLVRERSTAALVAVLSLQALFLGAMDVLFVVLAISALGMGESGVGLLNATFGAGGLLAVFVTLGLVGRRRLAPSLIGAAVVMGAAIAVIAAWSHVAIALVLLAAANVGRSLFDVSGRTLLQRTGSPAVLGRIFGVLESIDMLALALGSLLVSGLVALGGTDAAIVGVGALVPLLTLLLLPAILGADARATVPIVQIGLLRKMPLFRPLAPPEMEGVARAMEPVSAAPGEVLIREGDHGDRFYVIADGVVTVSTTGFTTDLTHGDGFGEVALLHNTPRTATVTAKTDVSLYALWRDDFLAAVTGMADVHHAAHGLAADRMAELAAARTVTPE